MLVTRAIQLAIYPNKQKLDTARYTYERHKLYAQHFVTQLYHQPHVKFFSTKGMGQLANKAQHKALGLLKAHREATKETGNKSNLPLVSYVGCPAIIETSKDSSFDFWLKVEDTFKKSGYVSFPVKSHKRLNHWIKKGYVLNPICEFVKNKNGKFYAIVFVQKEVAKAEPQSEALGCDVGYRNSVARSDNYLGVNTSKVIKRQRDKKAEQQRQNHSKSSVKTEVKQLLDIEAKRAIARCKSKSWSLVVENPKVLNNLRSGKLQGWARTYFAKRCYTLGEEEGVFVLAVNPAYTSITCSSCKVTDKQSRVKSVFKCASCNKEFHADVNAAKNIALKGKPVLEKFRNNQVVRRQDDSC